MSTTRDFENAPVGATATSPYGHIAFKTGIRDSEWSVYDSYGWYRDKQPSEEMEGYTLNPTAPTTAREALELAWELAHEVKEGQTITEGTRYLEFPNSELREYTAPISLDISPALVPKVRTLEPLSEPGPDWLDAPAVMARGKHWEADQNLDVFTRGGDMWQLYGCDQLFHWTDLADVTPLYPKGQDA